MEPIDVDDITEVTFPDRPPEDADAETVEVVFKDGTKKSYSSADFPEVLPVLNHWTPPTA